MLSETDQKFIDELQTGSAKGSGLLLLTTQRGLDGRTRTVALTYLPDGPGRPCWTVRTGTHVRPRGESRSGLGRAPGEGGQALARDRPERHGHSWA
ncbi:hypothetical protein ACIBI9_67315 [Nonomuraea sp. NPDC050451]|uniref:hypothetical protein n=1 Tax=Nonomuraea sp. NPDC050451 TaxID=3364364 RepID=UPI003790CB4B